MLELLIGWGEKEENDEEGKKSLKQKSFPWKFGSKWKRKVDAGKRREVVVESLIWGLV